MIGLLKRFFSFAVEQAQEFDAAMAPCQFENSNKDCFLVQQLKDKQEKKRNLEKEIKDYVTNSPVVVTNLYKFLKELEQSGFHMDSRFGRSCLEYSMDSSMGMVLIERALCQMTDESVRGIGEELCAIRDRRKTIAEKETALAAICADIAIIKTQLGIE